MALKRFWQSNLLHLLFLWIIVSIFIRPGWLIFGAGCLVWLGVLYLTAPGVFWTYFAFFNNNPEIALKRLRKAVSYHPAIVYPYFTLGMMTAKHKLWDEALRLLEHSVSIAPQSKVNQYRIVLAEAYRESGETGKAIRILTELLENGIASAKIYTDLAITYLRINDFSNALNFAKQARSLDLSAVQPVLVMGRSHFELGDYQSSKDDYEWAITHLKYPIESYYWLGLAEYHLGNTEAAIKQLQTAVDRITEDPLLSDVTLEEARMALEKAKEHGHI